MTIRRHGTVATSGACAAVTGSTNDTATAAVIGLSGDPAGSAYVDRVPWLDRALYGYANTTDTSSGVWGESGDVGLVGVSDRAFTAWKATGLLVVDSKARRSGSSRALTPAQRWLPTLAQERGRRRLRARTLRVGG